MTPNRRPLPRPLPTLALALLAAAGTAGTALAHGGALRSAAGTLVVPTWLFLLTGGGAVGVSFLLASLVTDRRLVRRVHRWRHEVPPGAVALAGRVAPLVGVLGLAGVLALGVLGPADPLRNAAVLAVWVGWWAGYVVTVYLVGNSWPALNPFRAVASVLPTLDVPYPERLGSWPGVVGLLALVYLEVVGPLVERPPVLSAVVAAYGLLTVAGAVVFGPEDWFANADPVSGVFRWYGRVAPIGRSADGLAVRLPGAALVDGGAVRGRDDVAFVVALVWVTTYDGLVGTPAWRDAARAVVGAGVPPLALYAAAMVGGFVAFYGVYAAATRLARRTADTYVDGAELARRFAPALLPIAAGYHLAHFLGYFLATSPALVVALASPLAPPDPVVAVLPGWFVGIELSFVLLGHLLAVWVAHATAFDLFPGRLQAVRSQYPVVAVMVAYTVASLWIVAEPGVSPPYL